MAAFRPRRARAHTPREPSAACALGLALALAGCGDDTSSAGGAGTGGSPATGGGGATSAGGAGGAAPITPTFLPPRTGLASGELALLVDDADPLSVAVAEAYAAARAIPATQIVHVTIADPSADALSDAEFEPIKAQVDAALEGTAAQALLVTWTKPYRVENMSITAALSLGFTPIGDTCVDPQSQALTPTPYRTKPRSTRPWDDLGFRPSMVLPATTIEEAQALIDRGLAAEASWPSGGAYLMITSDLIRSARCIEDPAYGWTNECQTLLDSWDGAAADAGGSGVAAGVVMADAVMGASDVLFYVQGLAAVPDLDTNTYLPGAVADHLTSFGGQIPTSGQMSAIEFLRAGATGSYGTVVEPCAFEQKFPDPSVLVPRYFAGATLVEAYWKSVDWPAEGIFLGDPLARPWGDGFRASFDGAALTVETSALWPGRDYVLEAADSAEGPWEDSGVAVPPEDRHRRVMLVVSPATRAFYRVRDLAP